VVDKVLRRLNGQTVQYTPIVASAGAADSGKLVALGPDGKLDSSTYNAGSGVSTRPIVASEAIGAGKFVNEYLNAGALNIRLADNSNNRPAHGFVIAAVASAGTGAVYDMDAVNSGLTGLTIGSDYYLGTAGSAIVTPVDATTAATGTIDQKLGKALSATELKTQDFDYVVI
jgi:hypothetical protein